MGVWNRGDFKGARGRGFPVKSLAPFTSFRLAKFRLALFADLRVQRLATKQNAEYTESD